MGSWGGLDRASVGHGADVTRRAKRAIEAVAGCGPMLELVTGDSTLADEVLAATAALGLEVRRVGEPGQVQGSGLVLVGTDAASAAVGAQWVERARACVVGRDACEVARWSVPLRAQVMVLPDQAPALTALLAAEVTGRGRGRAHVVAVVGGSGGVGVSTLVVGLAEAAVVAGLRAVVVDLDELGPGIDLVAGAEQGQGWRWPTLARASGEVANLTGSLVSCRGFDVLALERAGVGGEMAMLPNGLAVASVVRSLAGSHDLVLLDCGRGIGAVAVAGLEVAARVVVVASNRVTATAAARQVVVRLGRALAGRGSCVVRGGSGGLTGSEVAEWLGLPLLGLIPGDHALVSLIEQGSGPGGGRRWRIAVQEVLTALGVGHG